MRSESDLSSELVEISPVAIVVMDADEQVTAWNPAAAELFGYSPEEAIGRLIAQMQRCISEGVLPASLDAHVAVKLLWAPIFGIAALSLSDRIPTVEHADALARDAIEITIAGLRAGVARHAAPLGQPLAGEVETAAVEATAVDAVPST